MQSRAVFFFRGGGGGEHGSAVGGQRVSIPFFIFGDELKEHDAPGILEFIDMMFSSIRRGTRCSCEIYHKA